MDTILDTRAATFSAVCPRCGAQPGRHCLTPNGWRTIHKVRIAAGQGQPAPTPAKRTRRLSDAQAIRIEYAAENGRLYAPDQYAALRGDAANRNCADALERAGLIVQVATTNSSERVFELTADGWAAYHNDPRVIRRLPDDKHPAICPCH